MIGPRGKPEALLLSKKKVLVMLDLALSVVLVCAATVTVGAIGLTVYLVVDRFRGDGK